MKHGADFARRALDDEMGRIGLEFDNGMKTQIHQRIVKQTQSVGSGTGASIWNREIRIPIPVVLVPVILIGWLGGTLLLRGLPRGIHPTSSASVTVVELPTGVFSTAQLKFGESHGS